MAIDVSKIEGYADMTAEEKVAALEKYDFAESSAEKTDMSKMKEMLNKANSQAADWKRQLREKQSEQERLEAERAERDRDLLEQLESYKTKERISNYKDKLLGAGYDAETATKMANGLPDGVTDDFFDSQKKFLENQKKAMETEIMKSQTNLTPGSPLKKDEIEDPLVAAFRRGAGV